jgi:tetratricopeptide (TPR) repeat protein
MHDAQRRRQTWLICIGLALAVLGAYAPLWNAGFINYDDPDYVTGNLHVRPGLTWNGLMWALTSAHAGNWHPLTWLSHMLDVQLYGMNPFGHHLTSVVLHLANSILLFLLLQRLTSAVWPSAMVAALFALHPIHVESVAWISERKDVLSTLFWILSIWAYARWLEGTGQRFYVWSLVLFALGLAAKQMLVTLPFALLLLDYWPLQRWQTPFAKLLAEKTPFFILAAVSSIITFFVQRHFGAVMSLNKMSLGERLANVCVSYLRYLAKIFWPAHLALAYPMLKPPAVEVIAAAAFLLIFSGAAIGLVRTQPWLAVGWFWFLGTLVPVIGLVQVGMQSMADRYSYIPSIGLFIAVVWLLRSWSLRMDPRIPAIFGLSVAGICLALTCRQAACWKDDQALFSHAIQNSKANFLAYAELGDYEAREGRTNTALNYLETSVRINPNFATSRNSFGKILLMEGSNDQAIIQLKEALRIDPKYPVALYNLGYALLAEGRIGEALDQFQAQVNLEPEDFKAQENMGSVLLQNGLAADAIPFLQKAVAIKPDDAEAHYFLANALFRTSHAADAIHEYERAIQLNPDDIQALNDLAWILACDPQPSVRNGAKAMELALRAVKLSGEKNPVVIGTLAAAYAEAGKFPEASATEKRARHAALSQNNISLAASLERRLQLYQAGSPWRDTK